ncbi:hypothetical protein CHS0354_009652 [Potamilus streckersoni]|uniref:Uncharacterized protein n=1 Tax=Potamilus streckersoni TaxID=2493646 RepID=A0AAE0S4K3_9BIVA|nr:hypothetical protein CHS0354_009652 [Potamilus streckersoni]
MEAQKNQWVLVNSLWSHEKQINQDTLNTTLLTTPLDPNGNAECGINQDNETAVSRMNNAKCSGGMEHMHKSSLKLRICRCPEISAQDKRRHAIFCVSIIFMLLCLSIVFVAFANMIHRAEKSNFTTDNVTDDILLVVFGVAGFVSVLVALFSQRHANSSVFTVVRDFFGNSTEWTYTSIDKPCDATAGEVI